MHGGNAKLSSSDFATQPLLLTFGCHPLYIQEQASRFGKLFRESLASGNCAFSLEQTHVFTSPVIMADEHLASDTIFWNKTIPECLGSRLPRDYWWYDVPDNKDDFGIVRTPEWSKLMQDVPANCGFWQKEMQKQLKQKSLFKIKLQFGFMDKQPLVIWMAPQNRLHCIATLFPPFLPAGVFATDPLPSLVHQMFWRMDAPRVGRLCSIYAPDQLVLVANRRRAFVLSRGGLLTGLPGRLTEPETFVNSKFDPALPKLIESRFCFIALLHTFLYAEVMDKLRSLPTSFLSIADGLVHTVIKRYTSGLAQDAKSAVRSSRQLDVVYPRILPAKLANPRMQRLFDELCARYNQILSHLTAALKNLQDVLTGATDVEETMSTVKLSLIHAALVSQIPEDHASFAGSNLKLELRSMQIIPATDAYELLVRKMYVVQADELHQHMQSRETKMDIWGNGGGDGRPVHGNQCNLYTVHVFVTCSCVCSVRSGVPHRQ